MHACAGMHHRASRGFLQPWKRQILVAGLQLRLLHGLPAPWCQVAADLSSVATAEAAALREATGAEASHCLYVTCMKSVVIDVFPKMIFNQQSVAMFFSDWHC